MTDLTDEALDALVKLLNERLYRMGGESNDEMKLRHQSDRERAAAAITALRQREAEAVAGAIEAAAHLVSATAYTSNGGRRSLELVSKWLEGQDMHHATIATAIRSLHTDATRAALDKVRAEGMREAARIALGKAPLSEETVQSLGAAQIMNNLLTVGRSRAFHDASSAILAAADKLEGKP